MSNVQIEQTSYEMPPREGISIAHFLTVADIERSARYYEIPKHGETRCYIRDPDGYIIEVGQSTDVKYG